MASDHLLRARDGLGLAVRDHGGDGPDVVLVHGATRNLEDWGHMLDRLPGRLVAVDLRWHGRSGVPEAWSWDDFVDDLEAVMDQLGLDHPFLVGHSLGGMMVARYVARHDDCPGAVSLDARSFGDPTLYDGIPEDEAKAFIEGFRAHAGLMPSSFSGDEAWVREEVEANTEMDKLMGVPVDVARRVAERSFVDVGSGTFERRPPRAFLEAMREPMFATSMVDLFAEAKSPLVVVSATQPMGVPDEVARFFEANARATARAVVELDNPSLRTVSLPGSHGLHYELPDEVARIVADLVQLDT